MLRERPTICYESFSNRNHSEEPPDLYGDRENVCHSISSHRSIVLFDMSALTAGSGAYSNGALSQAWEQPGSWAGEHFGLYGTS